jgi:hypothetical protein
MSSGAPNPTIRMHRNYTTKFSLAAIRQVIALFLSYVPEHDRANIHRFNLVTVDDGETLNISNEEEFYLRYDNEFVSATVHVGLISSPWEPYHLQIIVVDDTRTDVTVHLPSRDHVNNILSLFTKYAATSIAPHQPITKTISKQANQQKVTIFIGHG